MGYSLHPKDVFSCFLPLYKGAKRIYAFDWSLLIGWNGYETIALSFCSLFSTVSLNKTNTFLHILNNEPVEMFGSGQSSIMNEHKTKDCVGLRSYSTSMFALLSASLKLAEFCNHSLY